MFVVTVVCLPLALSMMANCAIAKANGWAGMESKTGNTGYRGSSATIRRYYPYLDTLTGAWTGVQNSTNHGFAQEGWGRVISGWPTLNPYFFMEYFDKYGHTQGPVQLGLVPSPSGSGSDTYTVQYVSGGQIIYLRNGVQVDYTGYDWTPDQAIYSGEVVSTQDQMPGDLVTHEHFSNIQEYSSGAWHNLSPTGRMFNDDAAIWGTSSTSTAFDIWDMRYSHEQ